MQLTHIFIVLFQVANNDIHEKDIQTYSQNQNKEETSSIKRRKVEDCKASLLTGVNTSKTKLNVTNDTKDNNLSDRSKNSMTREHLLLGIFQKSTCHEVIREKQVHSSKMNPTSSLSLYKESQQKKDINFVNKAEVDKTTKLVRIFPGPAGLVTHTKNDNISVALYLNSLTKSESKSATEHTESNFSKSSQDEKNLLSEKAWKLLLDNLPRNFFNKYGIFTVKSKANASHCNSMKVKFVAGLLEYIDHSYDDPFIILKDSTDSIEGTVHRDIPLKYPGILEPNVVVLLHDVGLLKTTTRVVMNKYHILVSLENLLAVYSNKGRIMHTSRMENILSNILSVESTRDNCITPISNHCDSMVGVYTTPSISTSTNRQINPKPTLVNNFTQLSRPNEQHENCEEVSKKDSKATSQIFESYEHLTDMDDYMDDAFFTIENEPIASDENKYFNRLSSETSIAQISEIQQCELQTRNVNCSENMNGKSCVVKSEGKMISKSPVMKTKNSKSLASYFTGKTFHDNEFDSDDEFLSQLDVDNVVNSRKKDK